VASNRQTLFLTALAAGLSVGRAAARAGVSTRTASRYRADPGFQGRLAALESQLVETAMHKLNAAQVKAAAKLKRLLRSSNDAIALGACRAVLEAASTLRQAVRLEERLRKLEDQAQAQAKPFRGGFRA
jgi:hypothetical protein